MVRATEVARRHREPRERRSREVEVRDRHVVVGVALGPVRIGGEQRRRSLGEVRVIARDRVAPQERSRHGVDPDVVECLRGTLENEAVAFTGG